MRVTPDNWLELFDTEGMAHEDWSPPRAIRPEGTVLGYRTKTIRAGEQIEVMSYPIWSTAPELPDSAPVKKSAAAIARANAENARKHFERKMNTNLCDRDYRVDLTYAGDFLPDVDQAKRDVSNYLRRVNYALKKAGLPKSKFMGVSEGKREGSRQKRVHHHIVISCGLPREELESIWKKGRVRTDRLQADRFGYTALARYLMKEPEGAKRYFCSRNLREPTVTISDTKLCIRKAERIAQAAEESAPAIFERLYPGCEFLDCQVRHSDFVAGVYISVRLRKRATNNERRDKPCSGGGKARSAGRPRITGKGSTRSRCGSSAGGSGDTGRST